ncbi:hypothetical protein [Pseudomonas sp. SJZ079]|uniref:hypothetical protein n=1 Tax=Pseudomonas sp. SJZ079 TaxID=2572887 RepID=UPI0011BF0EB5|nr:hypothetical protein [Pseudomonas sp. SJZ079]
MKFKVSENFKIKGRRHTILASMLVALLIIGLVWMFFGSTTTTNQTISIVGIFLLLRYLPHAYRNIINNDSSYPELEILEHDNKLNISHKGATVSMPLTDFENLIIQNNKGQIKSILLTTKSFSNLRFEGYENQEVLAKLLKKYTPEGKTKIATWYHR